MTRRRAAVAGRFYPGDAEDLRVDVESYLRATPMVPASTAPPRERLRALVAPHAGYLYSGPTAGCAYRLLRDRAAPLRRIVIAGPAHYVPVRGIALCSADRWTTPLGEVLVDTDAASRLVATAGGGAALAVTVDDDAHAPEHCLEVQLPFLQVVAPGVPVLPLLVGSRDSGAVADALSQWWSDPESLVVVSTDLSHYEPHVAARAHDDRTADAVCRSDADGIGDRDACGARPLRALLRLASRDRAGVTVLDLRTSADTAGDPSRVVGYGAFALAA